LLGYSQGAAEGGETMSARPFNIGMKRQTPDVPPKRGVWIDHETGLIHGLPEGPQPLVGPTSGRAYEDLKAAEKKNEAAKRVMQRMMLSNWKCTQCRRVWKGTKVRVRFDEHHYEKFYCPDGKCDAPVVMCETVEQIAVRQAEERRRG
jgi:hypothetical protein